MVMPPSYFRARIEVFRYLISRHEPDGSMEKTSPRELLKQGFIHPDIKSSFEGYLKSLTSSGQMTGEPLTFTELCSFNTWFAMHPGKIAGTESLTTSQAFPITIKGTREDITRVIIVKDDKARRVRITRARAIAKLRTLSLLKS